MGVVTACAPTSSTPVGFETGPLDWRGTYEFYEEADVGAEEPPQFWAYELQISGDAPDYDARLTVNGFQTAIDALCVGRVSARENEEDRRLEIILRSYGEFESHYQPGAVLFVLERESAEQTPRTFWRELSPNIEKYQKSGGEYFKRAQADSNQ